LTNTCPHMRLLEICLKWLLEAQSGEQRGKTGQINQRLILRFDIQEVIEIGLSNDASRKFAPLCVICIKKTMATADLSVHELKRLSQRCAYPKGPFYCRNSRQ